MQDKTNNLGEEDLPAPKEWLLAFVGGLMELCKDEIAEAIQRIDAEIAAKNAQGSQAEPGRGGPDEINGASAT